MIWGWIVIGFFIGWIVELFIDQLFWRRQYGALSNRLKERDQQLAPLEAENQRLKMQLIQLEASKDQLEELKAELLTKTEAFQGCLAQLKTLNEVNQSLSNQLHQLTQTPSETLSTSDSDSAAYDFKGGVAPPQPEGEGLDLKPFRENGASNGSASLIKRTWQRLFKSSTAKEEPKK